MQALYSQLDGQCKKLRPISKSFFYEIITFCQHMIVIKHIYVLGGS